MRKISVISAALLLLILAQVGQAADLQAGWYVKLGLVSLFGTAPGQGTWGIDWNFTSPLGTSGPFEVTQPDPLWPQRVVSVPNTALGVPSGTAVYLYGQPQTPMQWPATDLQVTSETNYDASAMLVQMYVQHSSGLSEFLWLEPRSGRHTGGGSILHFGQSILPTDTIYFRVVAVPEPSQFATLLTPVLGVLMMRRRALR